MPPFTGTGLPLFSERGRGRRRRAAGKRSGRGPQAPQGSHGPLTWSDVLLSPHCYSTEKPDDEVIQKAVISGKLFVARMRDGIGALIDPALLGNPMAIPDAIPDGPTVGTNIPGTDYGNVELTYAGCPPLLLLEETLPSLMHGRFPLSRDTVTARVSALHEKAHGRPMTDAEKEHMWFIYRRYVFMVLEDNKVFKAPPQPAAAMTPAQGAWLRRLVVRPTPLADPVLWFVREKVRARIPSALWPEPMPWYPPVSKKEASRLIDALK